MRVLKKDISFYNFLVYKRNIYFWTHVRISTCILATLYARGETKTYRRVQGGTKKKRVNGRRNSCHVSRPVVGGALLFSEICASKRLKIGRFERNQQRKPGEIVSLFTSLSVYSETSMIIRLWMFTRNHNLMNATEEATSRLTFLSPGKYITMTSELWIFYTFLYISG